MISSLVPENSPPTLKPVSTACRVQKIQTDYGCAFCTALQTGNARDWSHVSSGSPESWTRKSNPAPENSPPILKLVSTAFRVQAGQIDRMVVFLQSFADRMCSGRRSCEFRVSELMHTGVRPCPMELSSYMEAANKCVQSRDFRTAQCELKICICKVLQMRFVQGSPVACCTSVTC